MTDLAPDVKTLLPVWQLREFILHASPAIARVTRDESRETRAWHDLARFGTAFGCVRTEKGPGGLLALHHRVLAGCSNTDQRKQGNGDREINSSEKCKI